jgi:hypothetical protein
LLEMRIELQQIQNLNNASQHRIKPHLNITFNVP